MAASPFRPVLDPMVQCAAYRRDRRNIATHCIGIPLIVFATGVLLARVVLACFTVAPVAGSAGSSAQGVGRACPLARRVAGDGCGVLRGRLQRSLHACALATRHAKNSRTAVRSMITAGMAIPAPGAETETARTAAYR